MIRSHSSWHSEDVTRWNAEQIRYQMHLKKIFRHLPPTLQRFVREFTLHDDRISEIQLVPRLPTGRDALVTIRVYRAGCVGPVALLVLHLVGVSGGVKPPPLDSAIMFFDVERVSPSIFRLSFGLEKRKTWTVKFGDFSYYSYDYQPKTRSLHLD